MSINQTPLSSTPASQAGTLLIHLLNRCNLLCQHCYVDATPKSTGRLPLDLVLRTLDEAEQLGMGTINLSGGEPFLYPELPEILAFVSSKPTFSLRVSSNGTLIGSEEAALLKDSQANLQVSIDGPEDYHDQFRGVKGAFRRTRRGIEHAVAAGVPVTIVITLCQDNKDCLPWLAEWGMELGVERVSVQPLLQLGRGFDIRETKLTEEQSGILFLQLSDLGHAYRARGLGFSLTHRTRRYLLAHPCAAYVCNGTRCHRKVVKEIKKVVIREDGTLLPEIPTLNPRFALGNLHQGSLTELAVDYLADGYVEFDHLCRTVYEEVMPAWTSPIVPWDEIVSERSLTWPMSNKTATNA